MSLAQRILAGPRGRRLCLEVAKHHDAVRETVFWAAWAVERDDASTSRAWFALDGTSLAEPPEVPQRTTADVARAIDAAIVDVDAATIDEALRSTVDSARHWQEPDEEDAIARDPVVRGALGAVAAGIAASDHWLHEGRAEASWLVRWVETPPRPPIDLAAARAEELADDARMRAIALDDGDVPISGAWWSTPQTPETVGRLPVALDLVEDELGWRGATATPMAEPERLLRIASVDDWLALCRAHPLDLTAARRHDWARSTGERHAWIVPDWVSVATRHDAVHLDARVWLEGSGRALALDDEHATVIAGWSPDATAWLVQPRPLDQHRPRRFERDEGDAWVEVRAP